MTSRTGEAAPSSDGSGGGEVVVVELDVPVTPARAQQVCASIQALLQEDPTRVVVLAVRGQADLGTLDVVARSQLAVRRLQAPPLQVQGSSDDVSALDGLLALTGLDGVAGAWRTPPLSAVTTDRADRGDRSARTATGPGSGAGA